MKFMSVNSYRYGYQGEYAEDETDESGIKANSFQLRLYDARIGRWLSPDPYGQYHSPYLAMGNTPNMSIDPDGGKVENDFFYNSKTGTTTEVKTNDNFDRLFVDGVESGVFDKGILGNGFSQGLVNPMNITKTISNFSNISGCNINYVAGDEGEFIGIMDIFTGAEWQAKGIHKLGEIGGITMEMEYINLNDNITSLRWVQTIRYSEGNDYYGPNVPFNDPTPAGKGYDNLPYYYSNLQMKDKLITSNGVKFTDTPYKLTVEGMTFKAELSLVGKYHGTHMESLYNIGWGFTVRGGAVKMLPTTPGIQPSSFHLNSF